MKKWKRILLLVLAAAMLLQIPVFAEDAIPGDVNGDGEKNTADAVHLLRYTLFSSMYPINQSADMNGDGSVTQADAIYLLRHILFSDLYPLKQNVSSCEHEEEILPAVSPTCTTSGLTEGKRCKKCESILVKQETVPALGHQYENNICLVCGEKKIFSEGLLYTLSDDETYYIVSGIGTCSDVNVLIPDTYEELPVRAIGQNAFAGSAALFIKIPQSVTEIGQGAFSGCSNLKFIQIPSGVTEISAFLFSGCSALTAVELPETVTAIGESAFAHCVALQAITLPIQLQTLGARAFSFCKAIERISLPDTVTAMGEGAFSDCTSLVQVQLSAALTKLENHAFSGCTALTSIAVPKNIRDIESGAFSDCSLLETAELSKALLEISDLAFHNCTALTKLVFDGTPDEWNALYKETTWDLGAGDYAVICLGEEEFSKGLYYTISEDQTYYIVSGIGTFGGAYIVIPDEYEGLPVKEIADSAFMMQVHIGGVKMNDGITKIGDSAFYGCSRLSEVHFSEGLREIGYRAFSATAITDAVLPSALQTIGSYAFSNCKELQRVWMSDSVTSLESYAFEGCYNLSDVTLSENLSAIKDGVFFYCKGLPELLLPCGITSIGMRAFAFCDTLTLTYDGTPTQWSFVSKSDGWDDETDIFLVCTREDTVIYPDSPELYASDYAYRSLASLPSGVAMQLLYEGMDAIVKAFHVSNQNIPSDSDGYLTGLNYKNLGLTLDEASAVWGAYTLDHPLYYWISNIIGYTKTSIFIKVDSSYYLAQDRQNYNAMIYSKVYEMALSTENTSSAYEIALAYHDFIIEGMDYAYEADGRTPSKAISAHNILGFFQKGSGVCESYAKVFQMLLNYSGIENVYVVGTAGGGGHAWNMIKLDDENWYWCDLTWDDMPGFAWGTIYSYFCVNNTDNVHFYHQDGDRVLSAATFLSEHTPSPKLDTTIYYMYELPAVSETSYDGILRDIFTVDGITYAVSGYRTVQLVYTEKSGLLEIPETVTYDGVTYTVTSIGGIKEDGLYTRTPVAPYATEIFIPKTVIYIWSYAFDFGFTEITVDENNPCYVSENGILAERIAYSLRPMQNVSAFTEIWTEKRMVCLEDQFS